MTDNQSDAFTIPDFLLRPYTDAEKVRTKRITARYRERRIKNPPKRVSRKMASGLGATFGVKIKAT